MREVRCGSWKVRLVNSGHFVGEDIGRPLTAKRQLQHCFLGQQLRLNVALRT